MSHDHDKGLAEDLRTMVSGMAQRRRVLSLLALAGVGTALAACGGSGETGAGGSGGGGAGGGGAGGGGAGGAGGMAGAGGAGTGGTGTTSSTTNDGVCAQIPPETAGPYPGDGTNGPNALALTGIVRSDITSSIAGASGVAEGVPLTVTLNVVNLKDGCAGLAGYAVYLWHCDADGNYSMYSAAAADENYLRGVQETDENGNVTFTTIFPGCYAGRWPHIHFEVYSSLAAATSGKNSIATSQLAFPEDICDEVYAGSGYPQSAQNLAMLSLTTDMVFADSYSLQVAEMGGSVAGGLKATLEVGVSG
ncbi:MAG: intradiol ring-cleavage dioxygenase [Polyangiaceae bacterium]